MNLVHCEDFKSFNLSVGDYFKRYFIGHYSPAGNHFFAYAIKDKVVDWLDPSRCPTETRPSRSSTSRGICRNTKLEITTSSRAAASCPALIDRAQVSTGLVPGLSQRSDN